MNSESENSATNSNLVTGEENSTTSTLSRPLTDRANSVGRRSKRARNSNSPADSATDSELKEQEEKANNEIPNSPITPAASRRNTGKKRSRQSRQSSATPAANKSTKKESKEEDSDEEDEEKRKQESNSAAALASSSASASSLPLLAPSSFRSEDLHCVVCMDFPTCEIHQCVNGHFLCKRCWTKVTDSEKTQCPTCRVYLNRDKPIRARFAEQILAGLLVECPLAPSGCQERISFSQVSHHTDNLCLYRAVQCKYFPLGCNWNGLALDQKKHYKSCEVKDWSPKQILKHVMARQEQKEKEVKMEKFKTKAYSNLCSYLSKRCRDIVFRDVHIETDMLTNERVANTFTACGLAWQLFLDPIKESQAQRNEQTQNSNNENSNSNTTINNNNNNSNEITNNSNTTSSSSSLSSTASIPPALIKSCHMHMKLISPIKRKTIVIILILPGPGLEMDFPPTITKVTYTRKAIESEPFKVHVTPERITEFYDRDSINLRVGFVECSRGKMMRHFSTLQSSSSRAQTQADDEDGDSDESSSSDSDSELNDLNSSDFSDSDEDSAIQLISTNYPRNSNYHRNNHSHSDRDDRIHQHGDSMDEDDSELMDSELDDFDDIDEDDLDDEEAELDYEFHDPENLEWAV